MNSAMRVSRCLVRKQCVRSSFVAKRSFIAHLPLAQERHQSCNHNFEGAVTTNVVQARYFSDKPTPAQTHNSNERESLIDGTPSAEIKQLSDDILNLNTLDMSILVEIIQRKLGISESLISGMMSGGGGGGSRGGGGGDSGSGAAAVAAEIVEPEKEKDAFDIKLTVVDPKSKIKIIKEVRALTGLGLKEAKDLVEKAPVIIKAGVKKEEVEAIKKILTEAGAQIEVL